MSRNILLGFIVILFVLAVSGCGSGSNSASNPDVDVEWVIVSGRVAYQGDAIHALVLVNGQDYFTSGNDGVFELEAPLDKTGLLTLRVFASGLAPFEQIIKPPNTTDLIVSLSPASPADPEMELTATIVSTDDDRMKIKGRLSSEKIPIGATVIANGQFTFSDLTDGSFEIVVLPAQNSKTISIMCFAQGYQPYSLSIPPLYATVEAFRTSYGTVKITGTIETLISKTECIDIWRPTCTSFWARAIVRAYIDANGQQTISSPEDGSFELETTPDASQTVELLYSTIENIQFATTLTEENIVPWTYLSVDPSALTMLTETTEIAHIIGGKAPYFVLSTNPSVATVSRLGNMVSIEGLAAGNAAIVISDSESYTTTIDLTVVSEGLGMESWVPVRAESDLNHSGNIDTYTYYTYSENGLLREDTDYNHDGTMEFAKYFFYEDDGRHCTIAYEYSNSGNLTGYQDLTFDDRGNLISLEDELSVSNYIYDDQGKILVYEHDFAKDGIIDSVIYSTYDSRGNLIKEERDEDNDGVIDTFSVNENTYNENGSLIQVRRDNFGDGTFEAAGYLVYNDDGVTLASVHLDFTNDGSVDMVVYFGPSNRVDYVEKTSIIQSYQWERRAFKHRLNIPDPLSHWVWGLF